MIDCNYRLIITQRSLKIPPESCVVCAEKKKSKVGQGRSFAVLSYQKIIWNCMFQRNNIQLQEVKWCFKQKYWKQLKKIIFTERKWQLPTEFKDKNKESLLMIMNSMNRTECFAMVEILVLHLMETDSGPHVAKLMRI